jgi:hypothetical protein
MGGLAVAPVILKAGIKAAVQDAVGMVLFIQKIDIKNLPIPFCKLSLGNLGNNLGQVFFY